MPSLSSTFYLIVPFLLSICTFSLFSISLFLPHSLTVSQRAANHLVGNVYILLLFSFCLCLSVEALKSTTLEPKPLFSTPCQLKRALTTTHIDSRSTARRAHCRMLSGHCPSHHCQDGEKTTTVPVFLCTFFSPPKPSPPPLIGRHWAPLCCLLTHRVVFFFFCLLTSLFYAASLCPVMLSSTDGGSLVPNKSATFFLFPSFTFCSHFLSLLASYYPLSLFRLHISKILPLSHTVVSIFFFSFFFLRISVGITNYLF